MSGEGDFIALPCSHQGNVAPLWCALQGLPCGLPAVGAGPVTWEHGGFYLLAAFSNTDAHSPSLPPCFLTFPPPQESCFLPQRRSAATSSSIPHLSEWASWREQRVAAGVGEKKGAFSSGSQGVFSFTWWMFLPPFQICNQTSVKCNQQVVSTIYLGAGRKSVLAGWLFQRLLAPYGQNHWSHWLGVESGRWVLGKPSPEASHTTVLKMPKNREGSRHSSGAG